MKLDDEELAHVFSSYWNNVSDFSFTPNDKSLIYHMVNQTSKQTELVLGAEQEKKIDRAWNDSADRWFRSGTKAVPFEAPTRACNMLDAMLKTAKDNSQRMPQGYRYSYEYKRFYAQNRMLAGPMATKLLQGNLVGCVPSLSGINQYIRRSDHLIVEGQLRTDELLVYLQERNQPMHVVLSEDATRIENRVQYDSTTNQLVGFVLPTDKCTGMPISFIYKARYAEGMIQHFVNDTPTAQYVNTVMAQPLGGASPFCLLVFGSDNRYTAEIVAKRWKHITSILHDMGINVLCISSDSDPRYNAAMRINSELGSISEQFSMNGIFKCGISSAPYYVQDFIHLATKLRNLLMRTINAPEKLPFGKFFIKMDHLSELLKRFDKSDHELSEANPSDKQCFENVAKICSAKVTTMLKKEIPGSEGTVMFLRIIAYSINVFMDPTLSPCDRLERMWYDLFVIRIWRRFISTQHGFSLKDNFLTSNTYYCMELNAHSMVSILLYLKENDLTHLFSSNLFCSQPCESFYRQLRSQTSTYSTVTNFTAKEILGRIGRVQLQNEISNDKDGGFIYPKAIRSMESSSVKYDPNDFPNRYQIEGIILKCQQRAIKDTAKFDLWKENDPSRCFSHVPVYSPNDAEDEHDLLETEEAITDATSSDLDEVVKKLFSSNLTNYSHKFIHKSITESSPYVEVRVGKNIRVFRKSFVCGYFFRNTYKSSNDRTYRVMGPRSRANLRSHK